MQISKQRQQINGLDFVVQFSFFLKSDAGNCLAVERDVN